jgi:formylmethanofuran dehydrogenase subunit A
MSLPETRYVCIAGGTIYDPRHGLDGVVGDVWLAGGKVVAAPDTPTAAVETIDAGGLVVMPGGVAMHTHVAGL